VLGFVGIWIGQGKTFFVAEQVAKLGVNDIPNIYRLKISLDGGNLKYKKKERNEKKEEIHVKCICSL
jgi:hypothetical protein